MRHVNTRSVKAMIAGVALLAGTALVAPMKGRAEEPASAPQASSEERWKALSEQEREAIRANYREWKQLPADRKAEIRWAYSELGKMSPEERQKVVANFRKFKSLPVDQQRKIRVRFEQFMKLSPDARKERLERLRQRREGVRDRLENLRERRTSTNR